MIHVLPGTPQQFTNFIHVFGEGLEEVKSLDQLRQFKGRPLVLLIGTWYQNPLRDEVLNWCKSTDSEGRPRGQAFAKMGSAVK